LSYNKLFYISFKLNKTENKFIKPTMDFDCDYAAAAADSKQWQQVNTQHGLLDWTLGELYGIPSTMICPSYYTALPESEPAAQAAQQPRTWVCIRKLTRECVISIFLVRLDSSRSASMLAREFGVTAKAIRDVWSQKSWSSTTSPFLLLPWQAGDSLLPPGETSPLAIAAAQQVSEAMAAAAHIRMQRKTGSLKRKIQVCLEGEQNKKDKKN